MRIIFGVKVRGYLLALLGFLVMLWNLGLPSLWQDEAATIAAANRPLSSLVQLVQHIDIVHGTYYAFMHFWGDAFGFTPLALRLPSAMAVGLSLGLLYALALKLGFGSKVATWSAIVFLALPRTDMAGSEARSNALTATLAIALVYAFVWAIESEASRLRWLAFVGLATLSIYVFMFSVLILAAFATYLLIKRRKQLLNFFVSSIIAIGLASPIFYFGYQERGQVGWITKKPIWQYLWEAMIGVDYNRNLALAAVCLLLAAFSIYKRASLLVLLWATLPSAILIAVSVVAQPYFVDHYLTFTTGGTAILIAIGISHLKLPRLTEDSKFNLGLQLLALLAVVALSLSSLVVSRQPSAKGTQWAAISDAIRANSSQGDGILLPDAVNPAARALDLMIVAYAPEYAGRIDLTLTAKPADTTRLFGKRSREVDAVEPQSNRVLLVTDPAEKDTVFRKLPSWMITGFRQSKSIAFDSAEIIVFDRIK
jgi:mannosyltransferase